MNHNPYRYQRVLCSADAHLSSECPERCQRFAEQLWTASQHQEAIFMLGDCFDHWPGDDERGAWLTPIVACFQRISAMTPLFLMRGNHDSLLGQAFAERVGATLIHEPYLIEVGGRRTVLCHGDALCSADVDFQRFRRGLYHPMLQRAFLALPYGWRMKLIDTIRNISRQSKPDKPREVMDVSPETVVGWLTEHRAEVMIHGHIHRPEHSVHHTGHGPCDRWVIGGWQGERLSTLQHTPEVGWLHD